MWPVTSVDEHVRERDQTVRRQVDFETGCDRSAAESRTNARTYPRTIMAAPRVSMCLNGKGGPKERFKVGRKALSLKKFPIAQYQPRRALLTTLSIVGDAPTMPASSVYCFSLLPASSLVGVLPIAGNTVCLSRPSTTFFLFFLRRGKDTDGRPIYMCSNKSASGYGIR